MRRSSSECQEQRQDKGMYFYTYCFRTCTVTIAMLAVVHADLSKLSRSSHTAVDSSFNHCTWRHCQRTTTRGSRTTRNSSAPVKKSRLSFQKRLLLQLQLQMAAASICPQAPENPKAEALKLNDRSALVSCDCIAATNQPLTITCCY